ncbi:hypothetical protein [Vibrio tritonius]|uniref:hypothetical protein n=1 Tax=Vibrio tritonius TaxID=1435069 RepID=UPI0012E32EEF
MANVKLIYVTFEPMMLWKTKLGQPVQGARYFRQQGIDDFHIPVIQTSRNGPKKRLLCDQLYRLLRMYQSPRYRSIPNTLSSSVWSL